MLFLWYFLIHPTTGRAATGLKLGDLMYAITAAVCILAIVKVIVAGSSTIDPVALRLLGGAALVDIAGSAVQPLLEGHPHVNGVELASPATGLLAMAAALQHLRWAARQGRADAATRTRRQYSVLPYVAVAAVQGLLLASLDHPERDPTVVALATVLLTGIVIARQLILRDNTRLTDQLAQQERRFRPLVQSASDVIAILDAEGRTTYVSPGAARLTGFRRTCCSARSTGSTPTAASRRSGRAGVAWSPRRAPRSPTGPGSARRRRLAVARGHQDEPAQRRRRWRCRHQPARHHRVARVPAALRPGVADSLTALANRSLFGDHLHQAITRSGPGRLSLALIDLDDFKAVNDTLGHQFGDELLVAVAERLRDSERPTDLVARLGGDEFAVLLEGIAPASVTTAAERILGALAQPVMVEHQELLVQASIGCWVLISTTFFGMV